MCKPFYNLTFQFKICLCLSLSISPLLPAADLYIRWHAIGRFTAKRLACIWDASLKTDTTWGMDVEVVKPWCFVGLSNGSDWSSCMRAAWTISGCRVWVFAFIPVLPGNAFPRTSIPDCASGELFWSRCALLLVRYLHSIGSQQWVWLKPCIKRRMRVCHLNVWYSTVRNLLVANEGFDKVKNPD